MKRLIPPLMCLFLIGCATSGRKIDQTAVERIQKGVSTKADVRSLIGAPDQVTKTSAGNEVWSYHYTRVTAKGENFIPVVGMFAGGMNTQNQWTMVTFGPDGLVQGVDTSYGGSEVGSGLSAGSRADVPDTDEGKRPK
jgi:outer membrane protein assembly factor BamE (lipoprotein component of BamABCDE complex)